MKFFEPVSKLLERRVSVRKHPQDKYIAFIDFEGLTTIVPVKSIIAIEAKREESDDDNFGPITYTLIRTLSGDYRTHSSISVVASAIGLHLGEDYGE